MIIFADGDSGIYASRRFRRRVDQWIMAAPPFNFDDERRLADK